MIVPDLVDVLAIAARVSDEDTATVLASADLDAIDEALANARTAAETGDCADAAGALLVGLVTRRPFPRRNRRIAMTVVVYVFTANGLRLDLGEVESVDRLLDDLAVGIGVASAADWLRRCAGQPPKPAEPPSERLTVHARRVLESAHEAAQELRHPAVGTEHILLGLLTEAGGAAARTLRGFALSAELVRAQIEVLYERGGRKPAPDTAERPFTARAERLLELASHAADQLCHSQVGTEHLLLGLAGQAEGLAVEALEKLGATPYEIQNRVFRMLAGDELAGATELAERQGGHLMFERFTDRARRVVVLAQEEARMLNHNYIGTEHVLLGLIHEGEGIAAKALRNLGVSLEAVRARVEEIIGQGQHMPAGHIPFTPRAKKVLELAMREALQLGANYIGTEHLLLGLVREGEGVAAQALVNLGADLDRVRDEVVKILGNYPGPARRSAPFSGFEQDEWSRLLEGGFEDVPGSVPSGLRRRRTLREIEELYDLVDRLRLENERLRGLLRSHDIEPDSPEGPDDIHPEDDEGLND